MLYNVRNLFSTSAMMVRKTCLEAVGNFSEKRELSSVEDYDLWMKLAKKKVRFKIIPDYLIYAHILTSSISRQSALHLNAHLALIKDHFITMATEKGSQWLAERRCQAICYYFFGRMAIDSGNRKEAWHLLKKGLAIYPFYWKLSAAVALLLYHTIK